MDCYYAAIEMRDFPEYRDIPLAVGGNGARSVLCTCNYKARAFGVRSAMSAIKAKQLCPELKIVNGRMAVYKDVSDKIREIFSRYTDLIEPLSLDEAYLDVTDVNACQGSATLIAEQIRADIFNELQLTASAGVAPNKFIAKIASDEHKPNGQCVVTPEQVIDFVKRLSLKKIPGIGPKTFEKLKRHGYNTCADIRCSDIRNLYPVVGKFANTLFLKAHGIDNSDLEVSRERKSLAIETTLSQDITSEHECLLVIEQLYMQLRVRLDKHIERTVIRQGVKLKFADFNQTTVEKKTHSCQQSLFNELLPKAYARANSRAIRLVGLTLGFAESNANDKQLSLPNF